MESAADVAPGKRRRIRELEAMVTETIQETPDTTTLVLFTGNDRLEHQPGHFLTIDPHDFLRSISSRPISKTRKASAR